MHCPIMMIHFFNLLNNKLKLCQTSILSTQYEIKYAVATTYFYYPSISQILNGDMKNKWQEAYNYVLSIFIFQTFRIKNLCARANSLST